MYTNSCLFYWFLRLFTSSKNLYSQNHKCNKNGIDITIKYLLGN
jgi:hypothetical protein